MTKTHSVDEDLQDEIHPGSTDDGSGHDDVVPDGLTSNKAENQTPGEMLREARLARQYTVQDLCGLTMLSRHAVEALEDNRYDELPQPVFVRGYYRKCAKTLDIDADRLLRAYGTSGGAAVAATSASAGGRIRVVPADVTPTRRRSFGFVLVILILIVAGLAGYLYWSQNFRVATPAGDGSGISLMNGLESGGSTTGATGTGNVTDAGSVAESADSGDAGQAGTAVAAPTGSGSSLAEGAAPVPVAAQSADSADAEPDGSAATPAPETAASAQPQAETAAAPTATASADTTGTAEAGAATDSTTLTIRFDARSWIDVHDATGKQLLVGIYEDTTRTVDGVPPYELVVGYAPGVSVRYHGKTVPIDAAGNNTARFSIGSENG